MQIIYHVSIYLYSLIAFVCSFFIPKARQWKNGRKGLRKKISEFDFKKDKWIWFHCSSLGEFNDGETLIEAIKKKYPHYKIVLTFFSPSGYENKKNYRNADLVLYLPFDTIRNSRFFIRSINPHVAFFIRNDIWFNYLMELKKQNIPAFLVSFTLNSNSKFLKFPQRNFYKAAFQNFNTVFVQDEESKFIMDKSMLNGNIVYTGNLRIDKVSSISKMKYENNFIEKFNDGNFCIVAGSAHKKDNELFLETYLRMQNANIKWIIVPHDVFQPEISAAQKMLGNKMVLMSEKEKLKSGVEILWIDEVGILSKIYRFANIVFIGGGFGKSGIHSILEPAVYGCPVCFGPNHRNYHEAIDLINSGGVEIINNTNGLEEFILKYYENNELLKSVNRKNKLYVQENTGATENILNYLSERNFLIKDF